MAELQKDICSICLHDLQQPKILDCKHQFCYICLDDYIYKTAANGQFPCPLCRQDITVPVGGVHDFPDKPHCDNSATSNVQQCDMCEEVSSTFRCVDCRQYMCKSCKTMHGKLPVCKDHVVIILADIYKAAVGPRGDNAGNGGDLVSVKDMCSNHKDKTVKAYCKQCSKAVCSKCFLTDHNGHVYSDLDDETTRQNIRDELQTLNTEILKHIQTLEAFSESLNMNLGELTDSVNTTCGKVDHQVVKICTEVKRLGESIKDDLKKTCKEEIDRYDGGKDLTKLMEDINKLTKDLKDSVKYSMNVLKDNSMVQMLNRLPTVRQEEKICSSRKLEIPKVSKIITFKESNIDTDFLRQQIGRTLTESQNIDKPSSAVSSEVVKESQNINKPSSAVGRGVVKESQNINKPSSAVGGGVVQESRNIYKPSSAVGRGAVKESQNVNKPSSAVSSGVVKESKNIHKPSFFRKWWSREDKLIYEHSFDVNNVSIEQCASSPDFLFSSNRLSVSVLLTDGDRLYTWLNRLTGDACGGYTYTVKLVNHVDDKQTIIQQDSGVVDMIDWDILCNPVNGFQVNNKFTIQVTDLKLSK